MVFLSAFNTIPLMYTEHGATAFKVIILIQLTR